MILNYQLIFEHALILKKIFNKKLFYFQTYASLCHHGNNYSTYTPNFDNKISTFSIVLFND